MMRMSKKNELSRADRLVLAMAALSDEGDSVFTEAQLTVKAWSLFPQHFGLEGYEEEYPDHKSVCTLYMGKDSKPKKLGYMAQEGQKRYRILPAGYQAAKKLQNKSDSVENQVYKIHPQAMEYLNIVAGSIAMTDYRTTGKVTDNNWNIVGSFFGVGMPSDGVGLVKSGARKGASDRAENDGAVNNLRTLLFDCIESGAEMVATTSGGGGTGTLAPISRGRIIEICKVFNGLIDVWGKHLEHIGVVQPETLKFDLGDLTDE